MSHSRPVGLAADTPGIAAAGPEGKKPAVDNLGSAERPDLGPAAKEVLQAGIAAEPAAAAELLPEVPAPVGRQPANHSKCKTWIPRQAAGAHLNKLLYGLHQTSAKTFESLYLIPDARTRMK
jgi:hypothetical protein